MLSRSSCTGLVTKHKLRKKLFKQFVVNECQRKYNIPNLVEVSYQQSFIKRNQFYSIVHIVTNNIANHIFFCSRVLIDNCQLHKVFIT